MAMLFISQELRARGRIGSALGGHHDEGLRV
jgi:hypothetical protein